MSIFDTITGAFIRSTPKSVRYDGYRKNKKNEEKIVEKIETPKEEKIEKQEIKEQCELCGKDEVCIALGSYNMEVLPRGCLNLVERTYFMNYLHSGKCMKSVNQIWIEILEKIETEQLPLVQIREITVERSDGTISEINASQKSCRKCARIIFKNYVFYYRILLIPPNDLPEKVRKRRDCKRGIECKIQDKHHHILAFNHACFNIDGKFYKSKKDKKEEVKMFRTDLNFPFWKANSVFDYFQRALEYMRAGNYEKSLRDVDKVLMEEEFNEAKFLKILILKEMNNIDEFRKELKAYLEDIKDDKSLVEEKIKKAEEVLGDSINIFSKKLPPPSSSISRQSQQKEILGDEQVKKRIENEVHKKMLKVKQKFSKDLENLQVMKDKEMFEKFEKYEQKIVDLKTQYKYQLLKIAREPSKKKNLLSKFVKSKGKKRDKVLNDFLDEPIPSKGKAKKTNKLEESERIDPDDIDILDSIGVGSFSEVVKCTYKGEVVAVKIIKDTKEVKREIDVISRLSHPYVVRYYGFSLFNDNKMGIVMEYLELGSLDKFVQENSLTDSEKYTIIKKLIYAIQFLHSKGIIHRDIRPANVLVHSREKIKLCDFGLSRIQKDKKKNRIIYSISQTNARYLPKESLDTGSQKKKFSVKSDVFMLGMTIYEIVFEEIPFPEKDEISVAIMISQFQHLDSLLDDDKREKGAKVFISLIEKCLGNLPEERPDTDELLRYMEEEENKMDFLDNSEPAPPPPTMDDYKEIKITKLEKGSVKKKRPAVCRKKGKRDVGFLEELKKFKLSNLKKSSVPEKKVKKSFVENSFLKELRKRRKQMNLDEGKDDKEKEDSDGETWYDL